MVYEKEECLEKPKGNRRDKKVHYGNLKPLNTLGLSWEKYTTCNNTENDTLRKNQKEVLEIRNTQIEMKNAFDWPISRLNTQKMLVNLKLDQWKLPKMKCKNNSNNNKKREKDQKRRQKLQNIKEQWQFQKVQCQDNLNIRREKETAEIFKEKNRKFLNLML